MSIQNIIWTVVVIIVAVALLRFLGSMESEVDAKNRAKNPTETKKPEDKLGKWWKDHKDKIQTLMLVALGLIAINMLCNKVEFVGWQRVNAHKAFLWLNVFLLFTVFLTLAGKNPVVKWVAGLIALIILVGGGRIWFGSTSRSSELASIQQSIPMVEVRYPVKSGEVSKILVCGDIVSWTDTPVYLRFNGVGDWKPWKHPGQKVPADTNTIEIKADKEDIIVVVKEPRPSV